jgi:hypothetical protein
MEQTRSSAASRRAGVCVRRKSLPFGSHPHLHHAIIDRWQNASSAYTLDHARRKLTQLLLRGKAKADADSDGNLGSWIERT